MNVAVAVEMAKRIELWPVKKLKPYQRNARTHSPAQVEKLAAMITEFGFTQPILVDAKAGIIAGHGRLKAAQALGLAQVPVIQLDHLTDQQKRAYIIADNRIALDAGWDEAMLAEELADLQGADFDLTLTGLDTEEIGDLLGSLDEEEEGEKSGAGGGDGYDFGAPVIAYNLVFDTTEQQTRFYAFLKWLKKNLEGETIAERLDNYLKERDLGEG